MKYIPNLNSEEKIRESYGRCEERRLFYLGRGLDFFGNRDLIFKHTGALSGRILEIGTGKGVTALALARLGYDFVSVDKNEEMLEIAAMNLAHEHLLQHADLRTMDAYSLELDDGGFGAVLMIEALHHIDDQEKAFSEIDRVLAPGGKFILSDFNKNGMEIVDSVHKHEGHAHVNLNVGYEKAHEWFTGRGYDMEIHDGDCHWILIATRINDIK